MKMPATLFRTSAAAILSRLLLVLGLLLGDLIPDPRAAQAAVAPTGAADLMADATPAILPTDSARLIAALPQDDTPDAVTARPSTLPPQRATAQTIAPALRIATPPRAAHLRPYPHGPPAV
jgi:hypothetical protein